MPFISLSLPLSVSKKDDCLWLNSLRCPCTAAPYAASYSRAVLLCSTASIPRRWSRLLEKSAACKYSSAFFVVIVLKAVFVPSVDLACCVPLSGSTVQRLCSSSRLLCCLCSGCACFCEVGGSLSTTRHPAVTFVRKRPRWEYYGQSLLDPVSLFFSSALNAER